MAAAMSAPAVAILSSLAEAMVDLALERGDDGMRAFDVALEHTRTAGALGAFSLLRGESARRREMAVLRRLDRDLLEGLLDTARE